MEYNHLQSLSLGAQRNRLILLHHFSELFCASLALFDLQPKMQEAIGYGTLVALDTLRGVLLPSGKVRKCVSPSTRTRAPSRKIRWDHIEIKTFKCIVMKTGKQC